MTEREFARADEYKNDYDAEYILSGEFMEQFEV